MKTELIRMEVDVERVFLFFCRETGGYREFGDMLIFTHNVRALTDLDPSYGVEIKPHKRIK